jgi:predicted NUDIX family NTP pyrophosphohydrolase
MAAVPDEMKRSAGILMYRFEGPELQVLLAHPGGPLWAARDEGAWTIPKGEFTDEDPLQAARREFEEETGFPVDGQFIPLSTCRLKSGKTVCAWAVEGNVDAAQVRSNMFEFHGREYPEVDRAEWFTLAMARRKINPAQRVFLEKLERALRAR